jgi:cyclohexyl-isocyanide hydratase
MPLIPADRHLHIGAIIYPSMDQIDFTGPFEVLSRLPNSTFHVLGKQRTAIRDTRGLLLTPEQTLSEAPHLDLLLVPGGYGQEDLMNDEEVLSFIRSHVERRGYLLAVCTGVLLCGAARVMNGVRATTHWRVLDLLPYFGAVVVTKRVVKHDRIVTAGGVTAGIDGALQMAAMLRGDQAAKEIQLYMQYAPEPPFDSGTPDRAPAEVLDAVKAATAAITARRLETAKQFARNALRSPD